MCFICVEDGVEQLTISDRVRKNKGSECCATNMLNSQLFDVIDVDEDNLCYSLVDNSEILSVNEATFDEPCCKADASDNEKEGLDECGVFAIAKYQLSQPQSEITIFDNVSLMQDDSDTNHISSLSSYN